MNIPLGEVVRFKTDGTANVSERVSPNSAKFEEWTRYEMGVDEAKQYCIDYKLDYGKMIGRDNA